MILYGPLDILFLSNRFLSKDIRSKLLNFYIKILQLYIRINSIVHQISFSILFSLFSLFIYFIYKIIKNFEYLKILTLYFIKKKLENDLIIHPFFYLYHFC